MIDLFAPFEALARAPMHHSNKPVWDSMDARRRRRATIGVYLLLLGVVVAACAFWEPWAFLGAALVMVAGCHQLRWWLGYRDRWVDPAFVQVMTFINPDGSLDVARAMNCGCDLTESNDG